MRNRYLLLLDVLLLPLAVLVSYILRLDTFNLPAFLPGILLMAGLCVAITPVVFRAAGVYSRYWRFASVDEMVLLGLSLAGAMLLVGALGLSIGQLGPFQGTVPRSIPVILLMLALAAVAGPRLILRASPSYRALRARGRASAKHTRAIVIGAGEAGAMIVRELRRNPQLGIEVAGFVDDDLGKHDVVIHGVPVLGARDSLERIVSAVGADQAIIAMPTAPGKIITDVVRRCRNAGIEPRIIPGIYELIDGKANVNQLRDVQIEDLLRREPIKTDVQAVEELVRGRRVLVTGGGGSIGGELCRQILNCNPQHLIVLGHGENSVFEIEQDLATLRGKRAPITPVIADIRFEARIREVFATHAPQIVFHTAAHKHVPLMEANPCEAVSNNVLGTRVVAEAALASGVERFVMISTDKAVNPTSVMGATKRVAELIVQQAALRSGRPYVAVRFGNVLGSRGSVVLTFRRQIAAGGPLTLTHPDVRRYFMTIPEAVQLVLQASVLGAGGEAFVLDMGEPIKILDLAQSMIQLSGLELGRDIDIKVTGLRPGEKLYEELFLQDEIYQRTAHGKIFIAANASRSMPGDLAQQIAQLEASASRNEGEQVISLLRALIPEYQPLESAKA